MDFDKTWTKQLQVAYNAKIIINFGYIPYIPNQMSPLDSLKYN